MNVLIESIKKFLQYEKKIFTTNVKDWTYLNIIVAGISLVVSIWSLVYLGFLLILNGFLWTATLVASILCFQWGKKAKNMDDTDRMFLNGFSIMFFIATILFFMLSVILPS